MHTCFEFNELKNDKVILGNVIESVKNSQRLSISGTRHYVDNIFSYASIISEYVCSSSPKLLR